MANPAEPALQAFAKVVGETAAFGSIYGCVVYVGSRTPVNATDWDQYLEFIAPMLTKDRPLPRVVWDDSGGPSPLGRQKLAALTQGCPVRVAIIADAPAGRNTATVLNWNRQQESYRTFPSRELREAIVFTGISGITLDRVKDALLELRAELGL
jgi:hypothetical protein